VGRSYHIRTYFSSICKSPVHVGLFRVSDEFIQIIAQGSLFANTPVNLFGVVPYKIFHERQVEFFWLIHIVGMIIGKLLLDSAIKPFKVPIGLWMTWIVEVMD